MYQAPLVLYIQHVICTFQIIKAHCNFQETMAPCTVFKPTAALAFRYSVLHS